MHLCILAARLENPPLMSQAFIQLPTFARQHIDIFGENIFSLYIFPLIHPDPSNLILNYLLDGLVIQWYLTSDCEEKADLV